MFHRYRKALLSLVAALAVCVALSGCGGKITRANADKIKPGMTEAEVKAILGEPTTAADTDKTDEKMSKSEKTGVKQWTWKNGDRLISIPFKDGKVHAPPFTSGL